MRSNETSIGSASVQLSKWGILTNTLIPVQLCHSDVKVGVDSVIYLYWDLFEYQQYLQCVVSPHINIVYVIDNKVSSSAYFHLSCHNLILAHVNCQIIYTILIFIFSVLLF